MEVPLTVLWNLAYRALDAYTHYAAPLNSDDYLKKYVASINNALDLMLSLNSLNSGQVRQGTLGLLQSAAQVLEAYHSSPKTRIVSNVMMPRVPTDELVRVSRFCDSSRRADSFDGFLELTMWSHQDDHRLPSDVILPIERTERVHDCLCGAPLAYVSNEVQVVDDTLDYRNWSGAEQARSQQEQYFKNHRGVLGSFVSFPVSLPNAVMDGPLLPRAVVNVQSNNRHAFGRSPGNRRKLILLMAPFMQVLGLCLARLHAAELEPSQSN
jgi:hypothetical protein